MASGMKQVTIDKIKKAGKDAKGRPFDFSKSEFVSMNTTIKAVCKIHGKFRAWPLDILNGRGCSMCAAMPPKPLKQVRPNNEKHARYWNKKYKENYISVVTDIHDGKYDYSKTEPYTKGSVYITVTCPKHGDFSIWASDHLHGRGCPLCADVGDESSTGYFYVYNIANTYIGFGITTNLVARNKTHRTSFREAAVKGRLVVVFEGSLQDVIRIESYLKKNLPIRSSGVTGFITESVHKQDKDRFIELLKRFYTSEKDTEQRSDPKIFLSDIDVTEYNK